MGTLLNFIKGITGARAAPFSLAMGEALQQSLVFKLSYGKQV